jgi:hypothetical protein
MRQTQRRMSIRNVAMTYGIPARTVTRAVANGDLPAVRTTTETGRQRIYVSFEDADTWFSSLTTNEVQHEKALA